MNKNKLDKYPSTVCQDCGYIGSDGRQFQISTWYKGKCDVCGMTTVVTEARDFYHCKNRTIKEILQLVKKSLKSKKD